MTRFGPQASQSGNQSEPIISVCISLKSRSRIDYEGQELKLFYNCICSLSRSSKEIGAIEVVVAGFQSGDWPVCEWIEEAAGEPHARLLEVERRFSRGGA